MRHAMQAAIAAIVLLLSIMPAFADNWVAVKLRGQVVQLIAKEWVPLKRGDIIPDDRVIRAMKTGKVQLQRGRETIDLGPDTQIRIIDKPGRQYTTVRQDFGLVAIEADVRNVEHFSVETPHLAAVVKGTKFVVTSGKSAASVKVIRGRVAVEDEHSGQSVVVVAGQTASTEIGQPLEVSGRGAGKAVVIDQNGQPVAKESRNSSGGGNSSPGAGNIVGNTVNAVGDTVSSTTSSVGNTVSSVGGSVGDAVGGSVGSTVSSATETVGATVGAVGGAVGGLIGGLL